MKHDEQLRLGYAFGPFLFDPQRRVLSRAEGTLRLGSRAREILGLLLESAGETVRKRDLMDRVWPGRIVEDGTLRVHIVALRKLLGDGEEGASRYVENVTGVGYRFMAPVRRVRADAEQSGVQPRQHAVLTGGPASQARMLGRERVVTQLVEAVQQKRLMTILGPGGVGKTSVALAAAEQLRGAFPDGVHHIDLHSATGPELIDMAISSVLGMGTAGDAEGGLAYGLFKRLLLVLDGCEHIVEAAAHHVDRLLTGAHGVHILATSREALRVRSECVLRLEPLGLPDPGAKLTISDALSFSSIELFVERARARLHGFELAEGDVSTVAAICHRLDGLPLAIELAANSVDIYGVRGLARRMDDYFAVLTQGCRTGIPRHQTLRATLDWSYQMLLPVEQQVLCRCAVFAGGFTAPSAVTVASDAASPASQITSILASLAAKSLLTVSTAGERVVYRLLHSSRAYALEKLESTHECTTIKGRHAQLCRVWVEEVSADEASPEHLCCRIEDIRVAIDWCLSPEGDPVLGLELVARSTPLWFRLSRISEYHIRLERALMILPEVAPGNFPLQLQLNMALDEVLVYTQGAGAAGIEAMQDRWRAGWGLCVDCLLAADAAAAVDLPGRFRQISGPADGGST